MPLGDHEIAPGRILVGRRDARNDLIAVGCMDEDGRLAHVNSCACDRHRFRHAVCKASTAIFKKAGLTH